MFLVFLLDDKLMVLWEQSHNKYTLLLTQITVNWPRIAILGVVNKTIVLYCIALHCIVHSSATTLTDQSSQGGTMYVSLENVPQLLVCSPHSAVKKQLILFFLTELAVSVRTLSSNCSVWCQNICVQFLLF